MFFRIQIGRCQTFNNVVKYKLGEVWDRETDNNVSELGVNVDRNENENNPTLLEMIVPKSTQFFPDSAVHY